MLKRSDGKAAIVTGSASGIGYAIAERLAADGAAVVIADINGEAAKAAAEKLHANGGRAVSQHLDVQDPDSAEKAVAFALQQFGKLDILVNNAGIVERAPFLECSVESWQSVISVNLSGTFICGQAAARIMASAGNGRIINIASVSGEFGGTGRCAYGASKAGIINLTKTMAVELGPLGINVNAIAPGPTQVARLSHSAGQRNAFLSRMALKRYALPADIAAAASFLTSTDANFITGHVLNVDGGFSAAGVLYDPAEAATTN